MTQQRPNMLPTWCQNCPKWTLKWVKNSGCFLMFLPFDPLGRPKPPPGCLFGSPFGSPLVPFGLLLPPFGLCVAPFGSSLAPFWLPLGSLWLPSAPFGTKPFHYMTVFDTFPLHMAPFGPKALHCMTFLALFQFTLPSLRHFCDTPQRNTPQHILHGLKGGISKQGREGVKPLPKGMWGMWEDR